MSEKKDLLKKVLKDNASLSGEVDLKAEAQKAVDAQTTALSSRAGAFANEVTGGVQSLTQKFDRAQDILNNTTTEGLMDAGAASIENLKSDLVNQAVSKISGAFGAKVEISFEEITLDGQTITVPQASSLDATGGVSGTLSSIIQLITGLGVNSIDGLTGSITEIAGEAAGDLAGELQAAVVDASADGLLKAGTDLTGKIGGFTADTINSLATGAVEGVMDELETAVGSVTDINRSITMPTSIETDDTSPNYGDITAGPITPRMPVGNDEFSSFIDNVKTNPLQSLGEVVTKASNIKQNLKSAAAKKDFADISGVTDGAKAIASAQEQQNLRNQYQALADEKNSLVSNRVASDGTNGIVQELSTETLTEIKRDVKKFAPKLKDADVTRVVNLSQGNSQEEQLAVDLLFQSTGKPADEIRAFLKTIDTTITNATRPDLDDIVFDEPYVIGSFEKEWKDGQGEPVFPYISSTEELQAELRNIKREVTEVVVHWTETPTNKNIGSEEINETHLANNLNGIGYHYVIRRDGSLQRGRPANIIGEHAVVNDHNQRSIGIVFVGGINVPSETRNIEDFTSVQSLTRSQFNTFDHFCRSFYNVFEGGQIVGHQDIDDLTNDPGFDVRAYVKANFDKDSKFDDPLNQSPFTTAEINE